MATTETRKRINRKGAIKNNPYGLGNLQIDACRIGTSETIKGRERTTAIHEGGLSVGENDYKQNDGGRWPSNVVLSHSPDCKQVGTKKVKGLGKAGPKSRPLGYGGKNVIKEWKANGTEGYCDKDGMETVEAWECSPDCPVNLLDQQSISGGMHAAGKARHKMITTNADCIAYDMSGTIDAFRYGDKGGASRFFYCAKACKSERNKGLTLPQKYLATMGDGIGEREHNKGQPSAYVANNHPTVKPLALMRWLTRLVCPDNGVVIDPFAGSGSGGVAAVQEGFFWQGCELSGEYAAICKARLGRGVESKVCISQSDWYTD